jgi:hypothetical protein
MNNPKGNPDTKIDSRGDSRNPIDHQHIQGEDSETRQPSKEGLQRPKGADNEDKMPGAVKDQIHEPGIPSEGPQQFGGGEGHSVGTGDSTVGIGGGSIGGGVGGGSTGGGVGGGI